jgi:type IX secretion system PorP/SprF family membrane protein
MKHKYLLFLFSIITTIIYAQRDIQITQYSLNMPYYNAAFTGIDKGIHSLLLVRSQWIGFTKPPETQFIDFNGYINKIKSGVGLTLIHDQLGYENNYNLHLNYAFPYYWDDNKAISIGASFNALWKRLDGSELIYEDMTDPNAILANESFYNYSMNLGLALLLNDFQLGISTIYLTNTNAHLSDLKKPGRHYYVFGQYKFNVNDYLSLTPSFLVKTDFVVYQGDVSLLSIYQNTLYLGVNYRINESASLLAGLMIFKDFKILYSYDFVLSDINKVSNSTHEITLSYDIKQKSSRPPINRSPRFF